MREVRITHQGEKEFNLSEERVIDRLFDGFREIMRRKVYKELVQTGGSAYMVVKDIAYVVTLADGSGYYAVSMAFTDASKRATTGVLAHCVCDDFDL